MSTNKKVDHICIAITAVALIVTILFMNGSNLGLMTAQASMGYESRLFDTDRVHTIDIVMDDWDSFIENCENEEYSSCAVVIDGESYKNIAIRAKGNTSLSSVRSMNSQRYSFKLEFDHYQSGKSYHGLDKLCLNNLIQDNTMMKDYLVYQMMADFGVDSPLCSFVYITVNGEDWGLYLAVEGIEDSFLARNYGSDTGDLYKPDSMSFGGGRGNGKDFNMDDFNNSQEDDSDSSSKTSSEQSVGPNGTAGTAGAGQSNAAGTAGAGQRGGQNGAGAGQNDAGGRVPEGGAMPDGFPENSSGEDAAQAGAAGSSAVSEGGMPAGGGFPGGFPDNFSGENAAQAGTAGEAASEYSISTGGGFPGGGHGGGPGGGMGSDDVKLKYIDDDPDSYSNIFENAKTDVTNSDKTRLIASLKKLSEYSDLEDILDMEEVLRYFVVHNFVVNGDSYTGSMIHNYYLHENDGKLGMIPWDYNLAFGSFQGNSASTAVNEDIDKPVSGGDVDDRPMVGWIFSDDFYTEQYHELFSEFIERWFSNGELSSMIRETADLIRPYVEKDPTKFCTTEEFEAGVTAISEFVTLRGEAVSRQLAGDDTQVETEDLNVSDMGTMNNGGGPGGMGEDGFSSMIKITDPDGNEVSVDDVIGDITSVSSIGLSDGTSVDVNMADFFSLFQIDFSQIVSVTLQSDEEIDLSGYSISLNFSGHGRHGGHMGFGGQQEEQLEEQQEGQQEEQNSQQEQQDSQPEKQNEQSGGTDSTGNTGDADISSADREQYMADGMPGMPGGAPGMNEQTQVSSQTLWGLTGVSVLVLAAGLLIAVRKRKTV